MKYTSKSVRFVKMANWGGFSEEELRRIQQKDEPRKFGKVCLCRNSTVLTWWGEMFIFLMIIL